VIYDKEVEIEKSIIEKQLKNTKDILREINYVPKTKELLKTSYKRTIDGLFK